MQISDIFRDVIIRDVRMVLDTDVVVAAMRSPSGASAAIIQAARRGKVALLLSVPLALVSAAPKNGAIMAGRKGPAMWLRYGHCRRNGARCEVAPVVLGGMSFRGLRLLGSVGLAFDLQDDRSLDQPVEEGHRQRAIGEIVAPFVEVHVGDHRRGALLIA